MKRVPMLAGTDGNEQALHTLLLPTLVWKHVRPFWEVLYHYTKSHEAVLTLIQVSCRLASTHVSVHYCKCTLTSIF